VDEAKYLTKVHNQQFFPFRFFYRMLLSTFAVWFLTPNLESGLN
jgi:hypothetical protein